MTRAVPRHDVGVMRRYSGQFPTSTEESLKAVMSSCFPESETVLPHHQNVIRFQNEALGPFTYPEQSFLTAETIEVAFKPFKNSKSPWQDKFKPRMLKQLPPVALAKLKQLFKVGYFSGYVPQEWRRTRVVFKPGKTDYSSGSSLPIC